MKKAHVPAFGNWEATGRIPYTQCFDLVVNNKTTKKASSPEECSKAPEAHAMMQPQQWMQFSKKAPLPAFGNWEAAGNIPYTQHFELVVKKEVTTKASKPNEFSKTPEAYAHDASTTTAAISHKVVPNHEDPKPPKASKPKDALQVKEKDGSVHQTATLVLDNQVKVPSSEGAKRTRKRPIQRGCTTSEVVVPPFGDWEKNPEISRKYTKVFQLIGDSRRYPGISIQLPLEETPKQDNTESKGCGCLPNLFK